MKNKFKLLIVALLVVGSSSIIWVNAENNNNVPVAINESASRSLYVKHCARCHGGDGKGNTKLGRDLAVPDLTTSSYSVSRIANVVRNGDGEMPAFGKKLTKAQINSVAAYAKGL